MCSPDLVVYYTYDPVAGDIISQGTEFINKIYTTKLYKNIKYN
jgi:hypothetical protein